MAKRTGSANLSGHVFRWCSLLTICYVALGFIVPEAQSTVQSYHLSTLDYRIAVTMVTLPSIVVWFFAFWGYAKLNQYVSSIKGTPEAKPFAKLVTGSAWLAWSLPITAIASRLLNAASTNHQSLRSTTTIITNYIDLIMPFIAFIIIGVAARGIVGNKKLELRLPAAKVIMPLFAVGGIAYCFLILKAFNLSSLSSTHNSYYLPAWLMVLSVIIPYLYAWFIGLLAAYEITLYALKLSGILYKRALLWLVGGLTAVIFSFIASQYLASVWPAPAHLIFNYRLVIITLFRIIGGIGFIVMAIGANRLRVIEEV